MTVGRLYRLSFPGGKSYIGITADTPVGRFSEHCKSARNGSALAVHRAIRKYGSAAVNVETLAVGAWAYLVALEAEAIKAFATRGAGGYNMTDGGEGVPGLVMTAEARSRMRAAHAGEKRRPLTAETRARIGAARLGWRPNAETRERLRACGLGKKPSEANRKALLAANIGRKRTEREKAMLRLARAGKTLSSEHRQKLREAKRGRPVSEATMRAAIAANTGRKISAEVCARRWAARRLNATRVVRDA